MPHLLKILVPTPAHARVGSLLTYRSELTLSAGSLVRVPLGKRETLGVVWAAESASNLTELDQSKLKDVSALLEGIDPLGANWQQLIRFSSAYYQRSLGEVALAALPPQLRDLTAAQVQRMIKKRSKEMDHPEAARSRSVGHEENPVAGRIPKLSEQQSAALQRILTETGPFLLFGATGSGKTEVYLNSAESVLREDAKAQVLVMVPEINLTAQLENGFRQRFQHLGEMGLVCMHSGMTEAQRLKSWMLAHSGHARIILGTRMAIFASMPGLRLIVVDEEHDPSYKSGEGARYSARDLALYRAKAEGARIILGSATPSLESWHGSRPTEEGGRYTRLSMPDRIGESASLPEVQFVDMNLQPRNTVFSSTLLAAIRERIDKGEQSLIFLNRRGYAPVLHCADCGWKSECPNCSAFRVFHKIDRTLRCHHCSHTERVPRACPACGNLDISPIGRGTERLEEHLVELLADVRRPDGSGVRVERIDADTTRLKGSLQSQLAAVHVGDVDVLVGTQMITKGHDFRNITLVAAISPDGALFSSDFRAPERLFSLLMQASGRAGRDATQSKGSQMWIQTFQPLHPIFAALKKHDYPRFAAQQLKEREMACLPPFCAQALLRAEARSQETAMAFLNAVREKAFERELARDITIYTAVPLSVQRVANVERVQMLVECSSRSLLQKFLLAWHEILQETRNEPQCRGIIRWSIDVDPLAI